jgi:hypothetical protein
VIDDQSWHQKEKENNKFLSLRGLLLLFLFTLWSTLTSNQLPPKGGELRSVRVGHKV